MLRSRLLLLLSLCLLAVVACQSGPADTTGEIGQDSAPPGALRPGDEIDGMHVVSAPEWDWDNNLYSLCDQENIRDLSSDGREKYEMDCTALAGASFIFNCAGVMGNTTEELKSEFAQLQVTMSLDGQPIDVAAFDYLDVPDVMQNPGGLIRMPAVMLQGITPGQHTLFCHGEHAGEVWDITGLFNVDEAASIELPAGADQKQYHGQSDRFSTLAEFHDLLQRSINDGQPYAIWNPVKAAGQMPLIFGDCAVFLYRGPAESVIWQGDFKQPYVRQGKSDTWLMLKQFELDARLKYTLLLDGSEAILDPRNPTVMGGFEPTSVMQMPEYAYPGETLARQDVPQGHLTPNTRISSQFLGYDKFYRVYIPAGYEAMQDLPVIYISDGTDAISDIYSGMLRVLDNLIADGRIRPIIAVFIDPHNATTGEYSRWLELVPGTQGDCPFCDFVVQEVVPAVDAAYRTDPTASARAIMGTSLGGPWAAYMGLAHSGTFQLIAARSLHLESTQWLLIAYETTERLPLRFFLHHGTYESGSQLPELRQILEARGYPVRYVETHSGHSYSSWRGTQAAMLEYFFPPPG